MVSLWVEGTRHLYVKPEHGIVKKITARWF